MAFAKSHLVVEDLRKTFTLHVLGGKRVAALRGVSFVVAPGEFVAILGPSGGGKSTLLKCVYRTYLATGGALNYRRADGEVVDLVGAPDDVMLALRDGEIGYVSQFLRPTPRVTAVDLVARSLLDRGVGKDEARERATALLRRLALPDDLLDGYPVLFSGGEQQRVNIARALIAPPRLLLLDEPTSALDTANQETVVALLREVHAAGTTILGTFHDLDLVRRLADRYLMIREGELPGSGPATEAGVESSLEAVVH
jgi:alpha-D-ribose 1-methylphosphonate 5-triphosphate synthase subunit PhnL